MPTPEFPSCVGSGFCCKRVPCAYGERDPVTGWCSFLVRWEEDFPVERYRCGKYDDIAGRPDAWITPAFGAGCSSSLFNEDRDRVLVALRARR